MVTDLNSKTLIYLLVYILIPSVFLIGLRKSKEDTLLEKNSTEALKGFLVIYVAIHHFVQKISNPELLNPLNHVGFLCVSFFFLMSGYGLTLGYNKNNKMEGFFKKRFLRLYFPFVIANIIIAILYNLILNSNYSIIKILITSFTMRTIHGKTILWYIFVQILMYLFFYLSFKIFKNRKFQVFSVIFLTIIYILIAKYLGQGAWRYNTALCFSIGVVIASYKDIAVSLLKKYYWIILSFLTFIFIITWRLVYVNFYSYYNTFISAIVFSILITVFTYKFKIDSKIFNCLGNISYEIYIIQLPIINIVVESIGLNILSLVVIIIVTILISFITNSLSQFINNKIR